MSARRVLVAAAWIVSVVAAFFLGASYRWLSVERAGVAGREARAREVEERRAPGKAERFTEPPTDAAVDIPKLIVQARHELGDDNDALSWLRAMGPVATLTVAQVQAALAELRRTVPDPEERSTFQQVLLSRWAELDGLAAMTYAQNELAVEVQFDKGLRATVLEVWAKREPDVAWRWYTENREKMGDDRLAGPLIGAVFRGIAGRDLELAMLRVSQVNEEQRMIAVNNIASKAVTDPKRRAVLDLAKDLPAKERTQLQSTVVVNWTISHWQSALRWIEEQPADEQSALRRMASSVLLSIQPAVGAEMMIAGASEQDKPDAYRVIIMNWAQRDAAAAAEWLRKQSQGPELDGARAQFASTVLTRDPAAAMDWAKAIRNDTERSQQVGRIFREWHRSDPAKAAAALDGAGLPPERVQELKRDVAPSPR
jgi:hypothetical protein